MHFDQLYPKRFMKAGQFGGKELTMRITGVMVEELKKDESGDKKETKAILSFARTKTQMVLNRTNGECLKAMFGVETDNWIGKLVTFYPCPMKDPFTGENIVAIRVRGSPEIAATKRWTVRLGKKMVTLTVQKTQQGQPTPELAAEAPPEAQADAPLIFEDEAGDAGEGPT